MNLTPPERNRPVPHRPTSGNLIRTCPYCAVDGRTDNLIDVWQTRSVTTGYATRWSRCEVCYAMWREVYNWELHVFEYAEHWKPRS